ncbi:MAG: hypothetical protein WBL95_27885 [Microcoleus sp.]
MVRYALCSMPYALCPMPYALGPMPYIKRAPHCYLERLYLLYHLSQNCH